MSSESRSEAHGVVAVGRSTRISLVAAVLAATALVAAESTIVATAMPTITGALHGNQLFVWAFTAYALTQTALGVVFGRMADVAGRRPVMLAGVAIFIGGSVLAASAPSMPVLIAGRLVQGVGAGAILPTSLTIVADLYPAAKRGAVQGWLASVWAAAAVGGPVLGGALIALASWRWLFWLNVPLGGATLIAFALLLRRETRLSEARVDVGSALLFLLSITGLLVALTDVAALDGVRIGCGLSSFIGFGYVFIRRELRAAEPMLPLGQLRRLPIAAANATAFVTGMVLMGATTFLPLYVQDVLHRPAVEAGLTLTSVMLGWPIGATAAARLFPVTGLGGLLLTGCLLVPLGASALALLSPIGGVMVFLAGAGSSVMGLGMGLASVASLIFVQESTPPERRASITASNLFSRNLGSTVGAAVLGAVQSWAASGRTAHAAGLAASLHVTFVALLLLACLSPLAALSIPRRDLRLGTAPA